VKHLVTTYSTVDWSADGLLVTKTRPKAPDARRRFRNELRVDRLLLSEHVPVRTPALVDFDVQHRRLTFEAVQGETLGSKYPTEISELEIVQMVKLARSLQHFSPRRRWLRAFDSSVRLRSAQRVGLLTTTQANALLVITQREHRTLSFAHGDITARNVMTSPQGLTLIDWEWAGLYPKDYDLAFLWFSLVDVSGGRELLEEIGQPREAFLLSALLIQLWHLQWFVGEPFKAKHFGTRDELLNRLDVN
jgi:Phosphotransferase enzyme family